MDSSLLSQELLALVRVIVKSGVWPIDSSGELVGIYHLDSIFEFSRSVSWKMGLFGVMLADAAQLDALDIMRSSARRLIIRCRG